MNQQVICEHLSRVGLKTVVAENGKVGVEAVQNRIKNGEKLFDLIFMDMHMPVMDGLEAAAKILEFNTGIPIVAITANIMSNDIEIYKKSGMSDYVGKPFTSQELWNCLLKYFTPVTGTNEQKTNIDIEPEFQREIEKIFFKSNKNKYEEIEKALEADDIKLAHRLAHTLKSNAGQIGKPLLQKAVAAIEHQLKDGKNLVTNEQMALIKKELNNVISQLEAEFASEPATQEPAVQTGSLDQESKRKLIEKLEHLLNMGNPESMELIDSLRQIPGSNELRQQIEDFDFEQAVVTLAELKKKCFT